MTKPETLSALNRRLPPSEELYFLKNRPHLFLSPSPENQACRNQYPASAYIYKCWHKVCIPFYKFTGVIHNKLKTEAMKTRIFTLYVSILMMGAVIGAAGQTARGRENGDHEKNSRTAIRSDEGTGTRRGVTRNEQPAIANERQAAASGVTDAERGRDLPDAGTRNPGDKPAMTRPSREHGPRGMNEKDAWEERSDGHKDTGSKWKGRDNREENRNGTSHREQGSGKYEDHGFNREEWYSRHNNWNERAYRNYAREDWENRKYAWNDRHWNFSHHYRDGHIPASFRNNRNYWYYPGYGHILRGFRHEPFLFFAGHNRYYFDNGFFYRYYRGIGYVWVEDPFGIWFNELPHGALRVRIGGKPYFRLGNAYFKAGPRGYRLVLLPDRYYGDGPAFYLSVNL